MSSSLRARFRHPKDDSSASNIPRKPVPLPKQSAVDSGSSSSKLAKRSSRNLSSARQTEHHRPTQIPTPRPGTTATRASPAPNATVISVARYPASRHSPLYFANPTPSLVAEAAVPPAAKSPRPQNLRRKPSTIDRYVAQQRSAEVHSWVPDPAQHVHESTVLGIMMPTNDSGGWEVHREWTPLQLPPSVASYAMTATPSTRYTDSPFSSAPTPSSMSSYASSPPIQPPARSTKREMTPKQTSSPPASRQVDRTAPRSSHSLPPVREASRSSSNATVKPSTASRASKSKQTPSPNTRPSRGGEKSFAAPTASSSTRAQRSTASTTASVKVHVPPELAHLVHDNIPKNSRTENHPRRPSRDGTATLEDTIGVSPVVRSDLPPVYTTYHKRTSSQEEPPLPSKSRLSLLSRSSSRRQSPRVDSARPDLDMTTATSSRTPTTTTQSPHGRRVLRKESPSLPPPSPSKSPARTSKLGLFHRRSKVEESTKEDKSLRRNSKGPAAGTGHEGYGRFSVRGRGGSIASSAGGRSASVTSAASSSDLRQTSTRGSNPSRRVSRGSSQEDSEMDDFLRQRLRPVYLRGSASTGSIASNGAFSTPDVHEDGLARSSTSTSLESYPTPQLLPLAMQQTRGSSPAKHSAFAQRKQSDVSDSESDIPRWTRLEGPAPPAVSPKKPSKWNFFQRAQASSRPKRKEPVQDFTTAASTTDGRTHGVAHYALSDVTHVVHLNEIEQILHDNELSADEYAGQHKSLPEQGSATSESKVSAEQMGTDTDFVVVELKKQPQLLRLDSSESPELLRAQTAVARASPNVVQISRSPSLVQRSGFEASTPSTQPRDEGVASSPKGNAPAFQSRLSPVGRIPRVVSKRDRDRKLPENSFSRPFAKALPRPTVKPPGTLYSQIREHASPEPGAQPQSSTSAGSLETSSTAESTGGTTTNRTSIGYGYPYPGNFLALPARKGSDESQSSSSNPRQLALQPAPPQQDDPWTEYNDLIDDMLPARTPVSASSSFGMPFQYTLSNANSPSIPPPLNLGSHPPSTRLPPVPQISSGGHVLSVPEQIAQLLKPSMSSLLTSHTLSDLFEDYGQRGSHGLPSPNRTSIPQPTRRQTSFNRYSTASTCCSVASTRNSVLVEAKDAQANEANASSMNLHTRDPCAPPDGKPPDINEFESEMPSKVKQLRANSITISEWLLRGRVLFSPAHDAMNLGEGSRVLVVDGLGTDWSYHVALHYPKASVYNLGPIPSIDEEASVPDTFKRSVPNHKHIPHTGLGASFPFPKGFFSVVVFRFPAAESNEAYHGALCECKRVLRPGGYLEVAVLDLDLKNMGPLARRAVRNLKIRMHTHDESVSLGNLSDVLVRMIGRRGFEEVQCCLLGLPVSSNLRLSNETSPSQPHASPSDDMTTTAASVGRWWYSRCYESALYGINKTNLWNDKPLLRECHVENTSFRLLICHAQKPTQALRRTVSV